MSEELPDAEKNRIVREFFRQRSADRRKHYKAIGLIQKQCWILADDADAFDDAVADLKARASARVKENPS